MRPSNQPAERRQFGRRNTRQQGWIEIGARRPISCFVINVSSTGALLELMDDLVLPYRFTLAIPDKGFKTPCEIRHTGHRSVGVRFCPEGDVTGERDPSKIVTSDYSRG